MGHDDKNAMALSAPLSPSLPLRSRSLVEAMADAKQRLETMELSCRELLRLSSASPLPPANAARELELLRLQVGELKARIEALVHAREDEDVAFQRAMDFAAAKGTANAVLHTLFDQASAGKHQVLESWLETGVIPTRDGLKHWRLDPTAIRNDAGATLLHVAVDASMARPALKAQLVALLVDRMGFDVNVTDVYGRTPLHVAAMAGSAEVVQALLERHADPARRNRAGLTALSVVRTLSRPPEDVVQLLATAESNALRAERPAASDCLNPKTALASALFLRSLARFVRPEHVEQFSPQASALLESLFVERFEATVAFDEALQQHVPLLFTTTDAVLQLRRLDSVFLPSMLWDSHFLRELKVEAAGFGLSLVEATTATAPAAAASWIGLLLKMIHALRVAWATPTATAADRAATASASASSSASSSPPPPALPATPPVRSPLYTYTERQSSSPRQAWHYAVLFKAASQPFPGVLSVEKGSDVVTCSEDVGRFFPLDDRLLIGAGEYHGVEYDATALQIRLDRPFEGPTAADVKAYVAGAGSSTLPPFVAAKRIWERQPGNKYEDHLSQEQEMFQDYQFLDPDSAYEVAVKLGPVPTAREARALVDEWKAKCRQVFDRKQCSSGLPSCEHYCPQRSGHSLCVDTMAAIGRGLAKERLGRPTFSKSLKARASLQKYQDRFHGRSSWPGSPSTPPPEARGPRSASATSRALDLT
ncbi:hypothetical protein P43SY_002242 [Pythium insidiosum]|uniref:Ankyrin repeat protein n=1 Tax=Pythium insidiosum TaxID=114742 RepID=A0AAD5QEX2_PYTIN|nr:hypothetical protein P43SY_002242 [Pythium insidiosum]